MQSKYKKLSRGVNYWLGVGIVGLTVGISIQFTQAWSNPAGAPPTGNVPGPLTTADGDQRKTGSLTLGGLSLTDGTQGDGKVLVSDPAGNATWEDPDNVTGEYVCPDSPNIDTSALSGWTTANVPSFCMDDECIVRTKYYKASDNTVYKIRDLRYIQDTEDAGRWFSSANPNGGYINGDTTTKRITYNFWNGDSNNPRYLNVYDDKSTTTGEVVSTKWSILDNLDKYYMKVYVCGKRDLLNSPSVSVTCPTNPQVTTKFLSGWSSGGLTIPSTCKDGTCIIRQDIFKVDPNNSSLAYLYRSRDYEYFQDTSTNKWRSSHNQGFTAVNGDTNSTNIVKPFASSSTNLDALLIRDDRNTTENSADKWSFRDNTGSYYMNVSVCKVN